MSKPMTKWPSGKHEGKVIADLSDGTLKWGRDLSKNLALREACKYELVIRGKMEAMAQPPPPPPLSVREVLSTNTPTVRESSATTPLTPHEVAELGMRNHAVRQVGPVVGEDQQMQAQMSPGVQALTMRDSTVTTRQAQPVLTESEAISLGLQTWHRFSRDQTQFTTVINSRRFIVDQSIFERMKVGGLALEGPPRKQ